MRAPGKKPPQRHALALVKPLGRHACRYCGLVELKNEATAAALRQPCDSDGERSKDTYA